MHVPFIIYFSKNCPCLALIKSFLTKKMHETDDVGTNELAKYL